MCPFSAVYPASRVPRTAGALESRQTQQLPSGHIQIHQSTGHEQPVGILGQFAVAHLNETKHPLEHVERMLDLRPYLRLGPVYRLIRLSQLPVPAPLLVREILRLRCSVFETAPTAVSSC